MFRAFTAASILVVAVTGAQAQTYASRGARAPYSANDVCSSVLSSRNETRQFYRTWYDTCMRTTGPAISRQMEAKAAAGYPRLASR